MADSDDLKPLLMKLMSVVEGMARDLSDVKTEQTLIRNEQTLIRGELKVMNARLDGFEKRLDDQGRILAALVPTRIAALPPPAAE